MSDSVSKQLKVIMDNLATTVIDGEDGQLDIFKLGSIYAEIDRARRHAIEQEEAQKAVMHLYLANNPDKLSNLLQKLADVMSINKTIKEDK